MLDGIDLDVGERRGRSRLIGASGSGKRTLLRCVNLLEPIDDGVILLDGDDISEPGRDRRPDPPAHRDGVPELQPVPPHTVVDNVALGPRKVLRRPARRRASGGR